MTRGAERLRDETAGHGGQALLVKDFNEGLPEAEWVDAPMVSRWVNGHRVPSPEQMARIEDLRKIPMRAWTEPAGGEQSGSAA